MGTDSTPVGAATTCLPWPGPERARSVRPGPRDLRTQTVVLRALARVSLGCLAMLLVGAPACLITADPDFTPPARSRPEIITSDACPPSPAVGKVALFQPTPPNSSYTPIEFSACVVSEDAGQDVQTVLLIDYGDDSGVALGPYRWAIPGEPLKAATLADGPREITIKWLPQKQEPPGCHTVTLLVTHQFQQINGIYHCPADANDAATLTWFAYVCDQTAIESCGAMICPIEGQTTSKYCAAAEPTP
jgi:hypothetical protein